eukprot:364500-Chlamydomonas_euryale.AAC.27
MHVQTSCLDYAQSLDKTLGAAPGADHNEERPLPVRATLPASATSAAAAARTPRSPPPASRAQTPYQVGPLAIAVSASRRTGSKPGWTRWRARRPPAAGPARSGGCESPDAQRVALLGYATLSRPAGTNLQSPKLRCRARTSTVSCAISCVLKSSSAVRQTGVPLALVDWCGLVRPRFIVSRNRCRGSNARWMAISCAKAAQKHRSSTRIHMQRQYTTRVRRRLRPLLTGVARSCGGLRSRNTAPGVLLPGSSPLAASRRTPLAAQRQHAPRIA